MRFTSWRTIIGVILAMTVGDGCQKPPPPPPPPPPPAWEVPAERPAQVSEMSQQLAAMNESIQRLPGTSQVEHQRAAAAVIDDLSRIVRLAQGSEVSPGFDNHLRVIDDAHAVLIHMNMEATRAEAQENEAMRSALAILQPIARRDEPKDPGFDALFNTAHIKLDAMYAVMGPMHDLAAKEGFQALAAVIGRLNDDLSRQYGVAGQG